MAQRKKKTMAPVVQAPPSEWNGEPDIKELRRAVNDAKAKVKEAHEILRVAMENFSSAESVAINARGELFNAQAALKAARAAKETP